MGTPDFAVPTLDLLIQQGHDLAAVITTPDRPAGRGKKLRPSPVKAAALAHGLLVLQPEKLRSPEFVQTLTDLAPDLAVVVAFRMLPEVVWSIPRIGTINLHASLLPDYRGAAPINWVLINGETQTGATTFFIDKKIDTGETLLKHPVDIPYEWTAGDLHDHLMHEGATLVGDTVSGLAEGSLTPRPQDDALALHPAPKIFKEDCQIDWHRSAEELYHFIRGLSPYPTAWTTLDDQNFKVFHSQIVPDLPLAVPGTLDVDPKGGFLRVACGTGWLELTEVQLQGKKRVLAGDFVRGYKGEMRRLGG